MAKNIYEEIQNMIIHDTTLCSVPWLIGVKIIGGTIIPYIDYADGDKEAQRSYNAYRYKGE